MQITVTSLIPETPRVAQVRGMFDLPRQEQSTLSWNVDLPIDEAPWQIGLVVGPSGCGKSTIASRLWPEALDHTTAFCHLERGCVLDAFPDNMPIAEICELLSSVGFSSPPAWLRPFKVLSTGQQFRAALALLLAATPAGGLVVCDEYSSVVDRTVAQIGSHALALTVRKRLGDLRFIAVTCHEDVGEWLQPDWVYRPAEGLFQWRCLRRRPAIQLEIVRCQASAWQLFAPHHYLSQAHARSAVCFLASWKDRPIAFSSWLPFVGSKKPARREHRTVTLPDYQGAGIGNALSAFIASLWKGLGYRALSTTTHPAMISSRRRSLLAHDPPSIVRQPTQRFQTRHDPSNGRLRIHRSSDDAVAGEDTSLVGVRSLESGVRRQSRTPDTGLQTPDFPHSTMPPTLEQIDAICARLRVGAFERVAVESAGISWRDYEKWLRDGGRPDGPIECKLVVESVRQARADGRLASEIELRKQDSKSWLLFGPGRQTVIQEGWGPGDKTGVHGHSLDRGWLMEVGAALFEALSDEPSACQKAAAVLDNMANQ